jgi:hypothetical protein
MWLACTNYNRRDPSVKVTFRRFRRAAKRVDARRRPWPWEISSCLSSVDEQSVTFSCLPRESAPGRTISGLWTAVDMWTTCVLSDSPPARQQGRSASPGGEDGVENAAGPSGETDETLTAGGVGGRAGLRRRDLPVRRSLDVPAAHGLLSQEPDSGRPDELRRDRCAPAENGGLRKLGVETRTAAAGAHKYNL